jgi:hypothetical protein
LKFLPYCCLNWLSITKVMIRELSIENLKQFINVFIMWLPLRIQTLQLVDLYHSNLSSKKAEFSRTETFQQKEWVACHSLFLLHISRKLKKTKERTERISVKIHMNADGEWSDVIYWLKKAQFSLSISKITLKWHSIHRFGRNEAFFQLVEVWLYDFEQILRYV